MIRSMLIATAAVAACLLLASCSEDTSTTGNIPDTQRPVPAQPLPAPNGPGGATPAGGGTGGQ